MYTLVFDDGTPEYEIDTTSTLVSSLPLFYSRMDVKFEDINGHTWHGISDCSLPHRELVNAIEHHVGNGGIKMAIAIDGVVKLNVICAGLNGAK